MTLELYHAEPVANSMKTLLCLKENDLKYVSHHVDLLRFEQHRPEFDLMTARPAVQGALSTPNRVPEVLRTFGG